ncbi:error-prone DNA polymerase (plasmid) [Asticcacaulis sp. DW145]|nr:error-prone DNA polymerase [Asticcacaulis sp. DW145]
MDALAIADRNTLAGIVRAHVAAKATGVRFIVGCRLDLADGMSLLVYPTDRAGYGHLCRLLTMGNHRAGKGKCELHWQDVEDFAEGLVAVLVPDDADAVCAQQMRRLKAVFADRAYVALCLRRRQGDYLRLHALSNLATQHRVPTVATNDVLYHSHDGEMLQDVVTCIRNRCKIDSIGDYREPYAERYLKSGEEMTRLFADYGQALLRTRQIADRCRFSLDELSYQYPDERLDGLSAMDALRKRVWEGAAWRYPEGVPQKVVDLLHHELDIIGRLDYAPYFLTVDYIVRYARSQDILCQGRGSAANSCVCFVLGITSIDPDRNDMLFERFVNEERREPPDIDVDFEHQRREIVMQHVFEHYGREKAALCCNVVRFRARGAIRETARALGYPEDFIKVLSRSVVGWSRSGFREEEAAGLGINLDDRRIMLLIELARQLIGTPRHLSQHPGGFILTSNRLDELAPIEPAAMDDRQVIQFDKTDIDDLEWMKVDCLALGMLSCLRRSFELLKIYKDIDLSMASIPAEDPRTYAMIRRADTLGVFQIESRAQRSFLPETRPETFWDLVVQIAIIRPGPIQGQMVHPYILRRKGLERPVYESQDMRDILEKTLGVPLFQEQVLRMVEVCAGFSRSKADLVRRAMATFKHTDGVKDFKDDIIDGMMAKGYSRELAERIYEQLRGFGSYGFPESHSASFALIAYASCWLKCHHPDVFTAALINSQPMGFYSVEQIVRDAKEHGVEIRPICIAKSHWDCTLEPTNRPGKFAIRLGFRLIKGVRTQVMAELIGARQDAPFVSISDVWRRAGTPVATLELLAKADAFVHAFGRDSRGAKYHIKALSDKPLPLFDDTVISEPEIELKKMTEGAKVVQDYQSFGLSLGQHPLAFLRSDFQSRGIVTCKEAMRQANGRHVIVAGKVQTRQMPPAANGVIFMSIDDESSDLNLIIWEKVGQLHRDAVLYGGLVIVSGTIQKEGDVVHLIARTVTDATAELAKIGLRNSGEQAPVERPDSGSWPGKSDLEATSFKSLGVHSRDFK